RFRRARLLARIDLHHHRFSLAAGASMMNSCRKSRWFVSVPPGAFSMSRWIVPLPLLLAVFPLIAKDKNDPPTPKESLALMKLPEGFKVERVAGEPTLIKPIAMTTDARGRLWVVETRSYPRWLPAGKKGRDRILILEPDGKGGYSCKVFQDNCANLSGIALGF